MFQILHSKPMSQLRPRQWGGVRQWRRLTEKSQNTCSKNNWLGLYLLTWKVQMTPGAQDGTSSNWSSSMRVGSSFKSRAVALQFGNFNLGTSGFMLSFWSHTPLALGIHASSSPIVIICFGGSNTFQRGQLEFINNRLPQSWLGRTHTNFRRVNTVRKEEEEQEESRVLFFLAKQ